MTFGCFVKNIQKCSNQGVANQEVADRMGLLLGGEQVKMAISCSVGIHDNSLYLHVVTAENYSVEKDKIHNILRSNFHLIAMQVKSSCRHLVLHTKCPVLSCTSTELSSLVLH
jgi:hypothetical protein